MNKKRGILSRIALTLLLDIALATATASSEVVIFAFDQNPTGSGEGNEGVTLHNPSNVSAEIGNCKLEMQMAKGKLSPKALSILYSGA